MSGISGAELFCRFAFPPNALGYCGPSENGLIRQLMETGTGAIDEMRHVVPAFAGAWPYLELIGLCTGRDPLDPRVVEAYWLGNRLLDQIDLLTLGNSLEDRFRSRAGWDWAAISEALNDGGRPTHSFHVFCIYPWVGLLQSGVVEQALSVLDRCRIRWGEVLGLIGEQVMVESQPLTWDGSSLALGPPRVETVSAPADGATIEGGDIVAMHWDHVCQKIDSGQTQTLRRYHQLHLSIANGFPSSIATRLEL